MTYAVLILGWILFAAVAAATIGFVVTSALERRWRPASVFAALSTLFLALLGFALPGDATIGNWIIVGVLAIAGISLVALGIPLGGRSPLRIPGPMTRVDERDAIFHRFYRLQPDTTDYECYYRDHPELEESDRKIRSLPQLGHPGSKSYHEFSSLFHRAVCDVLDRATRNVEWNPNPVQPAALPSPPDDVSRRLKGFAKHLGADLVGTTALNPSHVYSHIGRSPGPWGAPIELRHSHAIAIAVEMDFDMVRHAPQSPTVTETMRRYLDAAKIAMCVARYIHLLGYEARAHVDGNYRVLCVPIAVDAGLGELGRIGLLMTPEFGPRVRLAVVTTDLPLTQDQPVAFGVQHFCEFCKKCATCCPSAAIDPGDKTVHNGVEKWKSDQQRCYRFWRLQGTDCAVCMRVCPYAHPASLLHNGVRWSIKRNALARRLALYADDLLYGRRPQDKATFPAWHSID